MKKYYLIKVILVCSVILLAVFTAQDTHVVRAETALTPHQIAERNRPGVVMIYTVWKTSVNVSEPEIGQSKLPLLLIQAKSVSMLKHTHKVEL